MRKTMTQAAKRVRLARMQIMLSHRFFGNMLMCSPMVETTNVATAATDMRSIFYNPDFFDRISQDEVSGVIVHEVLHKTMSHGLRRGTRDPKRWNLACDYAINPLIIDAGFKLPKGCLFDMKYLGMSAEQIYDVLDNHGNNGGGGQSSSQDTIGEDLAEVPHDAEARAEITREIRQQVAQAVTTARLAGNFKGALAKLIDSVLDPAVPWNDVLREYMTRVSHDDESWSRRNRRFNHVILPSRYSQTMGPIVIIGDTSGSITQREFDRIGTEIQVIAENLRPQSIRVVWADTAVSSEQVFECNEPLALKPTGGGGTDMRVPLAHVEQYDPQVVILITDGETPWPTHDPQYPLIVCCTTKTNVPVGQVIRV